MEKQYARLLDPFLATIKEDAMSFDDNLWRLKEALNRIKGISYPWCRWRWHTIDEILKEREKLAIGFEKWRSGNQNDGAKTIQLVEVRKVVDQLEDMVDDIEYTQRKKHEAKFSTNQYIAQNFRLELKFKKIEDLLHKLRSIMEKFQKEFSAETIYSSTTEQTISYEETSEASDFVPESDCHHSTTEALVDKLFEERGNCVLTYGLSQETGKVTIPVQCIFKDKRVGTKFKLLVYVRASDRPISSKSHARKLEESIMEFMNYNIVNMVNGECRCCSNKKFEEDSRLNKEGSSNLCQQEDEILIKEKFKSETLLVLEDVLEDQLPKLLHLLFALSQGNTESRVVISSKSSEVVRSLSGMKFFSDKGKHGEKECTEGSPRKGKEKEDNEGPSRKQKQNVGDIIFWRFFRSFALRGENKNLEHITSERQLERIGERISFRLKRFPLGAKMIAKMLNGRRDCQFWAATLEKVCREVESVKCEHHQLQSLLHICYAELPAPLRLCFQYCSLFPSNWTFTVESLVRLWMSQGFLGKETLSRLNNDLDGGESLDDVGKSYFDELYYRSFFQKLTDDGSLYSLHTFVHSFAQVTAGEEFLRIESDIRPETAVHVRHLSVESTYLKSLYKVDELYSLRTLIIFGPINPAAPDILAKILPQLRTTRTLDLAGVEMKRLPELTDDLRKHLRYLSIYDTGIEKLPKDFCKFVQLQALNILGCGLKKFPPKVTRLCNLRHIDGPTFLTSDMQHVGKFKALQELEEFPVSKSHKIQELGGIKYVRGSITISNLEKVKSGNAARAKLHDKINLNSLKLEWSSRKVQKYMTPRPRIFGCSIYRNKISSSAKVLDHLKPHSGLRVLEINWYIGRTSPSWFTAEVLINMVGLRLTNCMNWHKPPPLGQLPNLKTLKLEKWSQLHSFGGDIFPMLEELSLEGIPELADFNDHPESFPCLTLLTIRNCKKLRQMPLFQSSVLAEIYVEDVGLENLPLRTVNPVNPSTSSVAESLTRLSIQKCPDLITVGGPYDGRVCLPASLLHLQITACRSIVLKLPFSLEESQMMEISQATDHTSENVKGESPLRLCTVHMDMISLLEPHFGHLKKLKKLVIEDPELVSLEKLAESLHGVLKKLYLINCEKLKALPEDMTRFSSLKSLRLKKCRRISSLPYLPYNLDELRVEDCSLLEKRYREGSAGWSMISHVPFKYI